MMSVSRTYHRQMGQARAGTMSPTSHYYEIQGRAAEIARGLGSPVGGAEHLFLGMLHDGGWPVSVISHLVDPGRAEEAVLGLLGAAGYSPPAPPRFYMPSGYVQLWGGDLARELGDSYLGVEHAFLAMMRQRDTVPARALAGLADLDAVEAAVLEAMNAPAAEAPDDAVFLPAGQELDSPLRRAIADALPEGTTFGFNDDGDERTWVHVFGRDGSAGPGVSREVLNTALASLGRPLLDG
jgi:ClpA/ClpB-like protein